MKNLERWIPRQGKSGMWGVCVEGTLQNPRWIILPNEHFDQADVGLLCETHNAAIALGDEQTIFVSSLVNDRLEPRISITIGSQVAQLPIREARQHVSHLNESIEAAMSDALLIRFVRDYVYRGAPDEEGKRAGVQLLVMFREFRRSINEPKEVVESEQ